MIRDKAGVDLRKDLHGVTLYGPDADKKHAVAIVFATVNKKLLIEKAQKASDHKVTRRGGIEIHSWTAKHFGKTEPAASAFYKDDAMVFAANVDGVSKAIDVLSGKSEGIHGRFQLAVGRHRPRHHGDHSGSGDSRQGQLPDSEAGQVVPRRHGRERREIVRSQEDRHEDARSGPTGQAISEGFKALASLYIADDADVMKLSAARRARCGRAPSRSAGKHPSTRCGT